MKRFIIRILIFILASPLMMSCLSRRGSQVFDLSGKWTFQIDSADAGVDAEWYLHPFGDSIELPGSMLTNGKGYDITENTKWTGGIWDSIWYKSPDFAKYRVAGNLKLSFWLQPLKHYTGPAWYSTTVSIPSSWDGQNIKLFFERCHWESTVWIDSVCAGMQNSLGTPHIFDLSKILTPGIHTITVRVDNRINEIDPGQDAHSLSDNTQTNWNGIAGRMMLTVSPAISITEVNLFPDTEEKRVRVRLILSSLSEKENECLLTMYAVPESIRKIRHLPKIRQSVRVEPGLNEFDLIYPMGEEPLLWDEFEPNLYSFFAEVKNGRATDTREILFGMRTIKPDGQKILVNGRPVFMRGTVECAVFPQTGYPPVTVDAWSEIFDRCREYGLNHVRFHSWCPPDAAFEAADRKGIYLAVECSAWTSPGNREPIDDYIYRESERIVTQFGNHPSFCMMAYGNEASGKEAVAFLTNFINFWKAKDNRRIYTSSSGFPESPASEYASTGTARLQLWNAGLSGPLNACSPSTAYDWRDSIDKSRPTISHETGQWCVYPDFNDIPLYDGVLKPGNFEIFHDRLEDNGMAHLADSFLHASGRLQVLCYKADIEAALRTPGLAGFQLLSLSDFPGQGTAPVGVLNAFWKPKPYTDKYEFSSFCNETVPLLRLEKMIFSSDEKLEATAQIIHYGKTPLSNTSANWTLSTSEGAIIRTGEFPPVNAGFGLTDLGMISCDFDDIQSPCQLKISLNIGAFVNSWDIWVYPHLRKETAGMKTIMVTHQLDEKAAGFLKKGGNVLLTLKKGSVKEEKGGNVPVGFSTIFWNTQWTSFSQPPFTMGIICDPAHSAFREFPTDWHSNYQWRDILMNCNAIRIDCLSMDIKPLVRIIDDWFTAKPLALIFECRTGGGKLLVCGADLVTGMSERPEAGQLLYSLKQYMSGTCFNPSTEIPVDEIRKLFYNQP